MDGPDFFPFFPPLVLDLLLLLPFFWEPHLSVFTLRLFFSNLPHGTSFSLFFCLLRCTSPLLSISPSETTFGPFFFFVLPFLDLSISLSSFTLLVTRLSIASVTAFSFALFFAVAPFDSFDLGFPSISSSSFFSSSPKSITPYFSSLPLFLAVSRTVLSAFSF